MAKNPVKTPVTDEIDLVDLIGVLIKRRSFIIWFIVIFTGVFSSLVFLKEFKKSFGPERIFTADLAVSVPKDPAFASYSFLKKTTDLEGYKKFLNSFLFPADVTAPTFEVQLDPAGSMDYFFSDERHMGEFVQRFNSFIEQVKGLSRVSSEMSEDVYASCRQLYVSKMLNVSTKDIFPNENDFRLCNTLNYYFGLIQGKLVYSLDNTTVGESYLNFLVEYSKFNHNDMALIEGKASKDDKTVFKFKYHFNKKKVIKYSVLVFILSVMLSVIFTYLIEFINNNRPRITKYWKR